MSNADNILYNDYSIKLGKAIIWSNKITTDNNSKFLGLLKYLFQSKANTKNTSQIVHSSTAVLIFDANGIILNANDTFLSITKYTLPDLEGQHYDNLVNKQHKDSLEYKSFWKNLQQGTCSNNTIQIITKDNQKFGC